MNDETILAVSIVTYLFGMFSLLVYSATKKKLIETISFAGSILSILIMVGLLLYTIFVL